MVDSDNPQLQVLYKGDIEVEFCSLDQSSVDSLKLNKQNLPNVNHADENGMENTTCNDLVMIRGQLTIEKQGKYAKNSEATSGSDDPEDLYDDGKSKYMDDDYDDHGRVIDTCTVASDIGVSSHDDPEGDYNDGEIYCRDDHYGNFGDSQDHSSSTYNGSLRSNVDSSTDDDCEGDYNDGEAYSRDAHYDNRGDSAEQGSLRTSSSVTSNVDNSTDDDHEGDYDDGEIFCRADHYADLCDSGDHGSLTHSCSVGTDVDNSTDDDPEGEYDDGEIEPRGAHSGELGDFGGHGSRTNLSTAGSYHHNNEGSSANYDTEDENDYNEIDPRRYNFENCSASGSDISSGNDNTYGLHQEKTQYRQTKVGAERQPNADSLDYISHYNKVINGDNYRDAMNSDWLTKFKPIDFSKHTYTIPQHESNLNSSNDTTGPICTSKVQPNVMVVGKDENVRCSEAKGPTDLNTETLKCNRYGEMSNKQVQRPIIEFEIGSEHKKVNHNLIHRYLATKACNKYSLIREIIISNEMWNLSNTKKDKVNSIHKILTPQIEEIYPACLTKLSNYRKNYVKRKISPEFSLIGKCVCESCPLLFKVVMMQLCNVGDKTLYILQGQRPLDPHPESWNLFSKSKKRAVAHEVVRTGASKTYYSMIGETPLHELKTGETKVPTMENLRQIAQRLRNEDKYDIDKERNLNLTAEVLRQADVESKVLPGYVQAENRVAGTKILFTEDQLRELARCNDDITLHMDATGSIIKK